LAGARDRRLDRGFGCIDLETRTNLHRHLGLPGSERPHLGRQDGGEGKVDAVVMDEVLRDSGDATPFEVLGACANQVTNAPDPDRDHAAARKRTNSDRKIDVVIHQIKRSILEHQFDIDLRILHEKLSNNRHHMQASENNGGDDETAGRSTIFVRRISLCLIYTIENVSARREIGPTGIGQRQTRGGSNQEPRFDPRFQFCNFLAHGWQYHA
jgi:hypothetical protein